MQLGVPYSTVFRILRETLLLSSYKLRNNQDINDVDKRNGWDLRSNVQFFYKYTLTSYREWFTPMNAH